MPSSSSFLALCVIASGLFGAALANPVARATCSPNFEGAGISILGANGFVTPDGRGHGSPNPFWHIEPTGQPISGYVFRDIANNNQVLTRNPGDSLTMGAATNGPDAQARSTCSPSLYIDEMYFAVVKSSPSSARPVRAALLSPLPGLLSPLTAR
ncbi:hypothetical protein AAF712_007226 [Marasmius tenuissimus]|uniref:Uncharacterized protein n=1 Tax=Marasmius tenuissimus TaxID=585030 RepID=A0ABR2ZWL3_9AGAR